MDKFLQGIFNHKKIIIAITLAAAVFCTLLAATVPANYNMVDYLPKDAQSAIAIKIMEEEFDGEIPNARIMLTNVSIHEVLEYKEKISAIEGISSVTWLDDVIGLDTLKSVPLEFLDESMLKSYYKDNCALITVSIKSGEESNAMNSIYELIGEENAAAGEAVNSAQIQGMSVTEVLNAMVILLPIVILILILSTSSWIEPLFFLLTIGTAIALNMGTNIIFGEISYITRTISPVLQLAVSLDYAIFLLHSFNNHRLNNDPEKAMKLAVKDSMSTIAASAATTMIGFAALMFMRFGIGSDLGLNLLKGIVFSFVTIIIFLPILILTFYKAIDKTRHRKLLPDFKKTGNMFMKIRIPFLLLALIVLIPAFLGQINTEFIYGIEDIAAASRVGADTKHIEEKFGRENPLVLLVPKGYPGKEKELCDSLSKLSHVTNIVSYSASVGSEIPPEFVPEEVYKQFYSENYSRIILYTDTSDENHVAFDTVQSVMDAASIYYDDSYYLAGTSAALYDMKKVVSIDTDLVNLIAVIGIFVVLLVTFASLSLPVLLIFTIETAIWINLAIPYFADQSLSFIGYLIISTVQLGATVDYAILMTNAYQNNRKILPKREAMRDAISNNIAAVLTSAIILASAGFALALTSNNPIISELGVLLGRGTLLSLIMVLCVLPALLVLFDKVIRKSTLKAKL